MRQSLKTAGVVIHGTIVTAAFSGACLALYFKEIPVSQRDIALILLGALISEFRSVGAFWTGSTASSQGKDATIERLALPAPTVAPMPAPLPPGGAQVTEEKKTTTTVAAS
jgi:hypothetical protein